jgi:uncharacterized damage-inducible protein DinB
MEGAMLADLFLVDFDAETATARKLLERVPDGKPEWRPHPKSMTLGRLATHVGELPEWVTNTFIHDELDLAPGGKVPEFFPILPSTAAMLEQFDRNVARARAVLAAATDADFQKPWALKWAGQTLWTKPKHEVFRIWAMNHLVHHRAQLGVYLRLLDVPIPGSYGPSADEQPAM